MVRRRPFLERIKRFLRFLYIKLFRINDSPHRIAAGFGLGVFFGVMPGLGPVVALALAIAFRVNRAAALLGGILTNTWLTIPLFFIAVRAGAILTETNGGAIYYAWSKLLKNFSWGKLFHMSFGDMILPLIIGYIAISLVFALVAYFVAFVLSKLRNEYKLLARLAIVTILAPKARRFENATRDPMSAQRKVLSEYVSRQRDTEYGIAHGFSGIRSIGDYRKSVPLNDCESLRPYIERMTRGEKNILTKDRVVFFGATSGTTAKPKYIPTTRFSDMKKSELTDIWSYYIARDHPRVLDGKILALMSPQVEGYTESGVAFGAESGHGYKDMSPFVKGLYALPYRVFEIEDYDARYYTILRIAIEKNITTVATLNPHSISLMCQKIALWREFLIKDIAKGTIDATFKIEKDIRSEIEAVLRPNPRRSAGLKRITEERGELLPKYFWPSLEIVECWKGGTMNVYLKELERYFGDVPIRDMGCLSTEARSSIPMTDIGAGGVLAIQTNFYEFIPREDAGKEDERVLTCDQLEAGREYFIVVTTAAGLYRYNIDDIIRVDGFFNSTPIIEFVQKGSGAASIAGEKLYESQVNEALSSTLSRTGLMVGFFCAVADPGGGSRYSLLVEFAGTAVQPSDKKKFLEVMEEELRSHNREYDFTRNVRLLGSPVLKVIRKGEFEKYRAKRISEGAHEGQFKVPELTQRSGFESNFAIEEEIRLD